MVAVTSPSGRSVVRMMRSLLPGGKFANSSKSAAMAVPGSTPSIATMRIGPAAPLDIRRSHWRTSLAERFHSSLAANRLANVWKRPGVEPRSINTANSLPSRVRIASSRSRLVFPVAGGPSTMTKGRSFQQCVGRPICRQPRKKQISGERDDPIHRVRRSSPPTVCPCLLGRWAPRRRFRAPSMPQLPISGRQPPL